MSIRPTTLERAFQLASSGEFADLKTLAERLRQENSDHALNQLHGPSLRKQLSNICKTSYQGALEAAV